MIEFRQVSFSYGGKAVLRDLSFRVERGSRRGLRGPSGSGKTTVLRLILGLETPDSGVVDIAKGPVSALFQENRLLPYLTVAENCALFATDKKTVAPMLEALGLREAAHCLPSALSGGMARRAALARTLCREAALYLLDEPFTGLDGESARRAAEAVNRVTAGRTVLAVSHRTEELEALGCGDWIDLDTKEGI